MQAHTLETNDPVLIILEKYVSPNGFPYRGILQKAVQEEVALQNFILCREKSRSN